MKVKLFLSALVASFLMSGCEVAAVDQISYDGRLTQHDITLVASQTLSSYMNPTYYRTTQSEYYYDYDGVIVEDSYIGEVSLITEDVFYGYPTMHPNRGNLKIVHDDMTIYLDVIDDVYVDVTVIDSYDSAYDITYITTWEALGF